MTWAILTVVLSAIGFGYNEAHSYFKHKLSNEAQKIAQNLYNKIRTNNSAINKLQQALNTKDAELANALFQGIGFGARVKSIENSRNKIRNNMNKQIDKLERDNQKYEDQIRNSENVMNKASDGTVMGLVQGYKQMDQLVNGGQTSGNTTITQNNGGK